MLCLKTLWLGHNYAIISNTLYMPHLCPSTKQTVHVPIILYHDTNCTFHHYAIPRNPLYKSPLCFSTKETLYVKIIL